MSPVARVVGGQPEVYFPQVEEQHPGAPASPWIPHDPPDLRRLGHFRDFLEAPKEQLAAELNQRMRERLHGDTDWLDGQMAVTPAPAELVGISSEADEAELEALNHSVAECGQLAYNFADSDSGEQKTMSGLAWSAGIQKELSEPLAVLLDEDAATLAVASQAGFRCFIEQAQFRDHVDQPMFAEGSVG